MAAVLPSNKLIQEQMKIAQWQQNQQKRRDELLNEPDPNIQRLERMKSAEQEYKQYREKTKGITKTIGQISMFSALSPFLPESLSPVKTTLDLAYIAGKPFRSLSKIKRAKYERMVEKELGVAGKVTRGLDIMSNLGVFTRSYPKALKLLSGGHINVGLPHSPTSYLMQSIPHAINFGLKKVGALAHMSSVPLLPTSGLAGMFTGMIPYMALSMGAGIMKANKLAKLQVQRKQGGQVEKQHSLSSSLYAQITRLIAENQLTPPDQLKLQLLQWIESHTSVIPVIYEELDLMQQGKSKGVKQLEKSQEYLKKDEKQSLLTKIENVVHGSILKYDPVTQLINFITSKKMPKDALQELLGTKDEEKRREFIETKTRQFGLNRQQFQLLTMDSAQVLRMVDTYESKLLAIQSGIYDLIRLSTTELTTIRAHGFGIPENLLYVKSASEEKSVFGRLFSSILNLPKMLTSLPGINALWNVVKLPFEAPKKIVGFFENAIKGVQTKLFGKEYIELLRNPEELLKKAGLYKSDQDLAYSFLGRAFPPLVEDIRKIEVEQLEVQQNMYYVLQEQLKHLTGLEVEYQETQKSLKEGKEWSATLGRYLSKEDYIERRKMEEQLIKHTLTRVFEQKGLLGSITGMLLGGNVEKRFKRMQKLSERLQLHEQFPQVLMPEQITRRAMTGTAGRLPEGFHKTFSEQIAEAERAKGSITEKFAKSKMVLRSGIPGIGGIHAALTFGSALVPGTPMLLPLLGTMFGAWKYAQVKRKYEQEHETKPVGVEKSEALKKTEEELIKQNIPKTFSEIREQTQEYRKKNISAIEQVSKLTRKIYIRVKSIPSQDIFVKLKQIHESIYDFKQQTVEILSNIYNFLTTRFAEEPKATPPEGGKIIERQHLKLIKSPKYNEICETVKETKVIPFKRRIEEEIPQEYKKVVGFAEGGVVTKDSLIRVGEKDKKEAIIPLENRKALSLVSKTIGDEIKKSIEKKTGKILHFPTSKTRTLRQELEEVEQKRERKKWDIFRSKVVELLTSISRHMGGVSVGKEKKKKEKSKFDLFGGLKTLLFSTIPFLVVKGFSLVKKGFGKAWDFIKSPIKAIKNLKDSAVSKVKSVVKKGKTVISKTVEFGKNIFSKGSKVAEEVGEVASKSKGVISKAGKIGSKAVEAGKGVLSKGVEVGSKILPKVGEIGSKALEVGAKVLPKAGLKLGSKLAGRAGALAIPGIGEIAAIGMSAYDAYKGWKEAGKAFGLEKGEKATFGMKLASAAGRALTLGLSDKKAAQWIYKLFGGRVHKKTGEVNKELLEERTKSVLEKGTPGYKEFMKGAEEETPEHVERPGESLFKQQRKQEKLGFSDKYKLPEYDVKSLEEIKKKSNNNMMAFVNKIVSFPLEVLKKFKDYTAEKLQSFKDAVKGAFSWIIELPKKLIEAIKDFLKNSFLGKMFKSLFGDEEVETDAEAKKDKKEDRQRTYHAASGGLFLKESLTHIAEQNKPEVVLPLENPKTHSIIQQYFETYGKKYEYGSDNREEFVKSALETVGKVTDQAIQQSEPKIIPIPQPVPQPIVTQQASTNIDSSGREKIPELQFDFVIEKHLNDIFRNTIITLEKSMQDYIYGNLAFNVA